MYRTPQRRALSPDSPREMYRSSSSPRPRRSPHRRGRSPDSRARSKSRPRSKSRGRSKSRPRSKSRSRTEHNRSRSRPRPRPHRSPSPYRYDGRDQRRYSPSHRDRSPRDYRSPDCRPTDRLDGGNENARNSPLPVEEPLPMPKKSILKKRTEVEATSRDGSPQVENYSSNKNLVGRQVGQVDQRASPLPPKEKMALSSQSILSQASAARKCDSPLVAGTLPTSTTIGRSSTTHEDLLGKTSLNAAAVVNPPQNRPSSSPASNFLNLRNDNTSAGFPFSFTSTSPATKGKAEAGGGYLLPNERMKNDPKPQSMPASVAEQKIRSLSEIEEEERFLYGDEEEKSQKQSKELATTAPPAPDKTDKNAPSEQEFFKIHDLLKTIGLDIGVAEIGKLAVRTQERLHGKKAAPKVPQVPAETTQTAPSTSPTQVKGQPQPAVKTETKEKTVSTPPPKAEAPVKPPGAPVKPTVTEKPPPASQSSGPSVKDSPSPQQATSKEKSQPKPKVETVGQPISTVQSSPISTVQAISTVQSISTVQPPQVSPVPELTPSPIYPPYNPSPMMPNYAVPPPSYNPYTPYVSYPTSNWPLYPVHQPLPAHPPSPHPPSAHPPPAHPPPAHMPPPPNPPVIGPPTPMHSVRSNLLVIETNADLSEVQTPVKNEGKSLTSQASGILAKHEADRRNKEVEKVKVLEELEGLRKDIAVKSENLDNLTAKVDQLKVQHGILLRKKRRERDGHKDPLLEELNNVLETARKQITSLTSEISDIKMKKQQLTKVAEILGVNPADLVEKAERPRKREKSTDSESSRDSDIEPKARRSSKEKSYSKTNRDSKERRDSKETSELKSCRESKERSDSKTGRESMERSDSKAGRESIERSDSRTGRESKERSDSRTGRESKERSDSRTGRESKERSDSRTGRESKERSDSRTGRESKERSDSKVKNDSKTHMDFSPDTDKKSSSKPDADRKSEDVVPSASSPRLSRNTTNTDGIKQKMSSPKLGSDTTDNGRTSSPLSIKSEESSMSQDMSRPKSPRSIAPSSNVSQVKEEHPPFDLKDIFEYYDSGGHWCEDCNAVCITLHEFLLHLHEKKHQESLKVQHRPWAKEKTSQVSGGRKQKVTVPFKGTEFLFPTRGYYCALCEQSFADHADADEHLRTYAHNEKFKRYTDENIDYEVSRRERKKASLFAAQIAVRKQAELKRKLVDQKNENHKQAEQKRKLAEQKKEEQKQAEQKRKLEEQKKEEIKQAEQKRKMEEQKKEEVKQAEQKRKMEEQKKEEIKQAEQKRKLAEQRNEEAKQAEQKRKLAEQKNEDHNKHKKARREHEEERSGRHKSRRSPSPDRTNRKRNSPLNRESVKGPSSTVFTWKGSESKSPVTSNTQKPEVPAQKGKEDEAKANVKQKGIEIKFLGKPSTNPSSPHRSSSSGPNSTTTSSSSAPNSTTSTVTSSSTVSSPSPTSSFKVRPNLPVPSTVLRKSTVAISKPAPLNMFLSIKSSDTTSKSLPVMKGKPPLVLPEDLISKAFGGQEVVLKEPQKAKQEPVSTGGTLSEASRDIKPDPEKTAPQSSKEQQESKPHELYDMFFKKVTVHPSQQSANTKEGKQFKTPQSTRVNASASSTSVLQTTVSKSEKLTQNTSTGAVQVGASTKTLNPSQVTPTQASNSSVETSKSTSATTTSKASQVLKDSSTSSNPAAVKSGSLPEEKGKESAEGKAAIKPEQVAPQFIKGATLSMNPLTGRLEYLSVQNAKPKEMSEPAPKEKKVAVTHIKNVRQINLQPVNPAPEVPPKPAYNQTMKLNQKFKREPLSLPTSLFGHVSDQSSKDIKIKSMTIQKPTIELTNSSAIPVSTSPSNVSSSTVTNSDRASSMQQELESYYKLIAAEENPEDLVASEDQDADIPAEVTSVPVSPKVQNPEKKRKLESPPFPLKTPGKQVSLDMVASEEVEESDMACEVPDTTTSISGLRMVQSSYGSLPTYGAMPRHAPPFSRGAVLLDKDYSKKAQASNPTPQYSMEELEALTTCDSD
ncbi:zinc finger protein 318 [Hyperolius riggenbachi]|uniref:zinc finger protein 318 n=1 Tax=Hyperolius riggenbachi TaxID=752182 RepID=UPI0035A3B4B3